MSRGLWLHVGSHREDDEALGMEWRRGGTEQEDFMAQEGAIKLLLTSSI